MARKGKMYDKEIKSSYLKETMLLKIYEPEQFSSIHETNICIMQDGDDYYQLGRLATVSDALHEDYDIVNTYFVGIHYIDRSDRLKKYHPDGEQYEAYKNFLAFEVVPLIEELVPINPLGIKRTLIGDSLAGTIALMTAIAHPTIFTKVLMQSPLVNDAVLEAAEDIEGLEIYHSIGLDEKAVDTTADGRVDFLEPNRKLHDIISEKTSVYHYQEITDGNHTWKHWQIELPEALSTLLS